MGSAEGAGFGALSEAESVDLLTGWLVCLSRKQ